MPVPTLPARRCLPLAAGLALLLCVPEPAASQEGTSTLVVHVRAVHAGRPLSGAQVILHGVGFGGTTAPDGSLRLHGLRPGSRTVEVRYLGYETRQALVTLVPGREATVRFLLAVEPIRLAEVRVRPRPSRLMRVGFYQRKASGNGTYFTREDIERLRPRTLSDMMRGVAGASVFMTGGGLGSTSFRGAAAGPALSRSSWTAPSPATC